MSYIRQYSELTPQEIRQLTYKRRYKQDHPDWDDSMVLLTNLVRERIAPGTIVLDFGCGRGNFVIDELRNAFSRVIGFDVLQESTEGNVTCDEIHIGDPSRLPLSDASVDLVISLWVFEHIKHPDVIMREIARVLKPGGYFAFVTPNKKSFLIALRRIMTDGIAQRLLKTLYGREEKDAFTVHYCMNTVKDITAVAQQFRFSPDIVMENADPSYTSFGPVTYFCSTLFTKLFGTYAQPHLVTMLRK